MLNRIKSNVNGVTFTTIEELSNAIKSSSRDYQIFDCSESTEELDKYTDNFKNNDDDDVKRNPLGWLTATVNDDDVDILVCEHYVDSGSDEYAYSFDIKY